MPPKGMSWADMVRGGANGGAKGRSTESPPSTPEMGPDKTTAPSASNDLQFSRGSVGSSGAGSSETAMHRPETKPADEPNGNASVLKGPAHWKEPCHRKGNKGTSKGSKGKQPTNPREVRVPKTSGKGSPPSSPEPQEREEACAQEPEPVHTHQSAGAKESQPSSKASTPREESAHPSGSCSARSSELPKKQEPEPAERAEPAEPADESNGKTVLTGWAKLFGGPSAAGPAPRKGNKGTSKGSKGKQPTNPREVRVPKTSGKGSPRSSPEEPEEREEACAQEPEPANAHQSAGAEESQPSSKASTPREESAHPSGSCSARSSELPKKQEPEPVEPVEPAEPAEPAAPEDESKGKTVLTGWAKLFEGGPSGADPAPKKGNKGTSRRTGQEVRVKGTGKGGLPSTLEPAPKITEAASALAGGCKPVHPFVKHPLESQPSSKAATQRDDSPHVSADSSSASSSGPPEPANAEQGKMALVTGWGNREENEASNQAVNGSQPAVPFEDGTDYTVPRLTKAGSADLESFEDGDGSEDLSNERLELDTFDYRTYYMNDLRNRDSDTEPTIYGSDSESSDEGF